MSQRRHLLLSPFLRQVGTHSTGRLGAAIVSAFWLILAARRLELAEFGDLAVLLSVAGILLITSDLGFPFALADAVARSGSVSRRTMGRVIGRRLCVGLGASVATVALYLIVAEDTRIVVPAIFSVSMMATVVYSSMTAALRGLGDFRVEAANDIVSRAVLVVAGSVLLGSGGGLLGIVIIYSAVDALSAVAIYLALRRRMSPNDKITQGALSFRVLAPVAGVRILMGVYWRVDLWLLALLDGPLAAGLYAAPYRILDGLLLVPRAAGSVAITTLASEEPARHTTTSVRALLRVPLLVGVIAFPLALAAPWILRVTFGQEYEGASGALVFLLMSAVPGSVVMMLSPVASMRDGGQTIRIVASALILNLAANGALIPVLGTTGAAMSTLASQLFLAHRLIAMFRGRVEVADEVIGGGPELGQSADDPLLVRLESSGHDEVRSTSVMSREWSVLVKYRRQRIHGS